MLIKNYGITVHVINYYNNRVNRGVGYPPTFPFTVGDYVLALTNKLSFSKGDEANLMNVYVY
jgi:hypothetical protein